MTTEIFVTPPTVLVAGTGPYAVPFPYADPSEVAVYVKTLIGETQLGKFFVTVSEPSATGGSFELHPEAATFHAGRQMTVRRRSAVEQGFLGRTSPEKAVEATLDLLARGIQDVRHELARRPALPVIDGVSDAILPQPEPGHLLEARTDGLGWKTGPAAVDFDRVALAADAIIASLDQVKDMQVDVTFVETDTAEAVDFDPESNRLTLTIPRPAAGADGTSVTIRGRVDDEASLPRPGDSANAYIIGSDLYVWLDDAGDYSNMGPIRGPKGNRGDDGTSAFQQWLAAGGVGDFDDFLADIASGIRFAARSAAEKRDIRDALDIATRARSRLELGQLAAVSEDGTPIIFDGLLFEVKEGAGVIPDQPNAIPRGEPKLRHFGDNADPGVTDMTAALNAYVAFLCSGKDQADGALDVLKGGIGGLIDLEGDRVLVSSPIVIGNVGGVGSGWTFGLVIDNGMVLPDPEGDWSDLAADVPGYVFVVADHRQFDSTEDNLRLHKVVFGETLVIDCRHVTGGVFFENTRDSAFFGLIGRVAPRATGLRTSIGSPAKNARGVKTKNMALRLQGAIHGAGNFLDAASPVFRFDGICAFQSASTAGPLAMNGADASGGEWVSPTGKPEFVEMRSGTPYNDVGASVIVTGFSDMARTNPITATIVARQNSTPFQCSYSSKRFAVVTGVSSNGAFAGNIALNGSMQNHGVEIYTPDAKLTDLVISSGHNVSLRIGDNGSVFCQACHFWSREVVIDDDALYSSSFDGVLFDNTDLRVNTFDHVLSNLSFFGNNCRLVLVANEPDETGYPLTYGGFAVEAHRTKPVVDYETKGGGSWVEPPRRRMSVIPDGARRDPSDPILAAGEHSQLMVTEFGTTYFGNNRGSGGGAIMQWTPAPATDSWYLTPLDQDGLTPDTEQYFAWRGDLRHFVTQRLSVDRLLFGLGAALGGGNLARIETVNGQLQLIGTDEAGSYDFDNQLTVEPGFGWRIGGVNGRGGLIHQGNLLGTTAMTGGVPTGRVFESGANENGSYERRASGWQTVKMSGVEFSQFASGRLFADIVFPAAFLDSTWVGHSTFRTPGAGASGVSFAQFATPSENEIATPHYGDKTRTQCRVWINTYPGATPFQLGDALAVDWTFEGRWA